MPSPDTTDPSPETMPISSKVAELLAAAEPTAEPGPALQEILDNIATLSTPASVADDISAVCDFVLNRSMGVVSARAVLDGVVRVLKTLDGADGGASGDGNKADSGPVQIAVGSHVLQRLETEAVAASFGEQVAALCDVVASAHEAAENWGEAARVLAAMSLDGSARRLSQEDKARVWVRIVRDYLEEDDSTRAEAYLNKLKGIIYAVPDAELNLHFRLSQARINDAKREFLAAATVYHEISYSPAIAEEERLHTLGVAVTCAILAPAGPSRSRVLGRLYKDDRVAGLAEFSMLQNMFLDRLLAPADVARFARGLQPHQLATTADGSTVLAKAVVEHNLLGVSRLYRNIRLADLATLLDLDVARAEETTARMIEQGRLVGRIDQIDAAVWFEGGDASGRKGSGRADRLVDGELRLWDANVQSLAEEVENITNALQREFPAFTAQNLIV